MNAPAAPTDRQVRLAWNLHFRGRRGCPDTLAETLAHARWGPCLRAAARITNAGGVHHTHPGAAAAAASRLGRGTWIPPDPTAHRSTPASAPHRPAARVGAHDAKRAAANDIHKD